ncbi:MAG: GNAT family N-acetyltransferase [Prolixibacteraceae bacterium]|nr:GNAT family N-acetyltransferase [Prolixibacteraceae bacterium]
MFTQEIICSDDVKLVKPDVERDVLLGMQWMAGEMGKQTMRLMGAVIDDNFGSNEQEETERISGFLTNPDQLNWMVEYKGKVVGAVWVDLICKYEVKPPSVHIMIGDESARGKGVGPAAEGAVLDYLVAQGKVPIFSRTLANNERMLHVAIDKLGYKKDGPLYTDKEGLTWQYLIKE